MKTQIVVLHGGDSFNTYDDFLTSLKNKEINFEDYRTGKKDWKETLRDKFSDDFEVIRPNMPNARNAKYNEWKIWFEKFVPYFDSYILLGHSLGGLFLVKYLSENKIPKVPRAVFLVAPAWSEGDFVLSDDLSRVSDNGKIFIYHSEDDKVVSFEELKKYQAVLMSATVRTFTDRGHFDQEEFSEIVTDIKWVQSSII